MPWYNDLRPLSDENKVNYSLIFPNLTNTDRKQIIQNILSLRKILSEKIPAKKTDKTLLLASWNIKEFGHLTKRLPESYFYIAEIINSFDLVAIQEVKSSLTDLNIVMKLLGNSWKYIITDITEGNDGNNERFAYIYDSRKVESSGLSGEIVLWEELTKESNIKQLKRSPAISGFNAGWKSFSIINVHLHPSNTEEDQQYRKEEVCLLMEAIREKLENNHFWDENLILLGDTNLYKNNDEIVDLFYQTGFRESDGLKGKYTNVSDSEIYDRIFLNVNEYFKLLKNSEGDENGDVFRIFEAVFTKDQCSLYHSVMNSQRDSDKQLSTDDDFLDYYNRYWKRNQLSDHNPIWIEIEIDSSDDFLNEKLNEID